MNKEEDKNYISVGSWMGMMFIMAIPVIGLIMILIWAFAGENDSRKNYYRAIIAWVLIMVALSVALVLAAGLFGNWSVIQERIQGWMHKA